MLTLSFARTLNASRSCSGVVWSSVILTCGNRYVGGCPPTSEWTYKEVNERFECDRTIFTQEFVVDDV